jgi:LruC domain-containing protein
VHLPGVATAKVASASLSQGTAAARAVNVEAGQTEATWVVFSSSLAQMPISTDAACAFANTQGSCPTIAPVPYMLRVNFAQPLAASLFNAPYNPFIFRSARRGQEVHLPGKPATQRAESVLFGTADDRTVASSTTTYMDEQRRPWALDIPTPWAWPLETTDLLRPYPRFSQWATSAGAQARDWYLTGVLTQHTIGRP